MQPIQELLNQIRWDPNFQGSRFEIGYYDRIEDKILRIAFREMFFSKEDHFDFQLVDEEGEIHTIPLHRIKEVYRDGTLIWQRKH